MLLLCVHSCGRPASRCTGHLRQLRKVPLGLASGADVKWSTGAGILHLLPSRRKGGLNRIHHRLLLRPACSRRCTTGRHNWLLLLRPLRFFPLRLASGADVIRSTVGRILHLPPSRWNSGGDKGSNSGSDGGSNSHSGLGTRRHLRFITGAIVPRWCRPTRSLSHVIDKKRAARASVQTIVPLGLGTILGNRLCLQVLVICPASCIQHRFPTRGQHGLGLWSWSWGSSSWGVSGCGCDGRRWLPLRCTIHVNEIRAL